MLRIVRLLLCVFALSATHSYSGGLIKFCYSTGSPFAFGNTEIADKGYLVEIVNSIVAELDNIEAAIHLMPWEVCHAAVVRNKMDAITMLSKTPERSKKYIFSESLFMLQDRLFYMKPRFPNGIKWNDPKSLTAYRFGLVYGVSNGDIINELMTDKNFKAEYTEKERLNFMKLKAGRIDVYPNQLHFVRPLIKELGLKDKIAWTEQVIYEAPVHFGFSKRYRHSAVLKQINKAIRKLKANGVIDQILAKEYDFKPDEF